MARPPSPPSERQRARSLAHRQLDSEPSPGAGARAAGLIAWEDGYDELAEWLLASLPEDLVDAPVRVARQVMAWRRDQAGFAEEVAASVARLPAAEAAGLWLQLWQGTCRCARPLEALQVVRAGRHAGSLPGDARAWSQVEQNLRRLGDSPPEAHSANPEVWIATLPDGQVPSATAPPDRASFLDASAKWCERMTGSGGTGGLLSRWPLPWRRLQPAHSPRVVAGCVGRLPPVPAGHLVLIPGGVLDRYTARHWRAALDSWPEVRIASLRVHDPGAADPGLVEALRRHGPVGAADLTSWWLLHEWGVEALPDPPPAEFCHGRADDLWHQPGPASRAGSSWGRLAEAWRSSPSATSLRTAWVTWARDAAMVSVGSSAVPATPLPVADILPLVDAVRSKDILPTGVGAPSLVEVALAVDDRLAEHAAVVMESCLAKSSLPLRFHVLTRGVGPEHLERWRRLLHGRAGLKWHGFDEVRYPGRLRLLGHTSVSTLDRLLLPELLQAFPRVIYLDIDLVVMGDLATLWHLDLGDLALAARPSHSVGTRWGLQMLYRAVAALPAKEATSARDALHCSGPLGFRAFNAGVLVMNLERMRTDRAAALSIGLVERYAMNDQDALNAYTRGNYVALPTAWNAAPRQDVTVGARIIHFVGPVKPWDELYVSRRTEFERVQCEVLRRLQETAHG